MIALRIYEILGNSLVVHIVYMEAQPESNPTLDKGDPKYIGIGRLMIAYGIKLSINNGFAGDVVLEAKTTSLARHYEKEFGAVPLSVFDASVPRYLIADEAAKRIFFTYFFVTEAGLLVEIRKEIPVSGAEWYCRRELEEERFYEIFSRCAGSME